MFPFRYAVDEFPMMENLSFSVEEGDFVSIIGASGCGKKHDFPFNQWIGAAAEGRDSGERKAHPRAEAIQCIYAAEGFAFFHGGRLRKISVCRWSWQVCLRRNRRSGAGMLTQVGLLEYMKKIPEGFIGRHEAEGFLCAHAAFGGGYAPAG